MFDFMSEAEDRDRIPHRDDRGARLQALLHRLSTRVARSSMLGVASPPG